MRAPVIQVLGKPPTDYKGGFGNYNHYDQPHPHNWEKRGGRYHDEWEKRGSFSNSGGGGGVLRISEGARNAIFSGDAGRPPGRGDGESGDTDGSQNTAAVTPTPVILSRARSNSEQRSTSPNPSVATVRLVSKVIFCVSVFLVIYVYVAAFTFVYIILLEANIDKR